MEIVTLTAFISPFLPSLLKLGGKAIDKSAESAASKFGEIAVKKAQAIWEKLSPKVEAKESAKEAVMDVAKNPDDEDLQVVLRVQIKKLLEQDEELLNLIAEIFQADDSISDNKVVQNVTGNQNQVIGQVTGGSVTAVIDRRGVVVENPPTASTKYNDLMEISPEETTRRVVAFESFVERKRQLWEGLTPEEQSVSDEQFEELSKSLAESRR
jgi:uncharacterized protein YqcC (DUF446 family)